VCLIADEAASPSAAAAGVAASTMESNSSCVKLLWLVLLLFISRHLLARYAVRLMLLEGLLLCFLQ
jgi:hypothetical protein